MKKFIAICCVVLIAGVAVAQTKPAGTTTKTTTTGTDQKPKVEKIRTPMKTAELMKEITDYITKNYAGYTTSKAEKVSTDKVITFEVVVAKGDAKSTLTFNDKGAFVKAKVHPVATPKPTEEKKK